MAKQKNVLKVYKYFTKTLLMKAATEGEGWDYNRQLDPDAIATLPDFNFPVTHHFIHEHRHFEPCEPHVRCVVMIATTLPKSIPDPNWKCSYAVVDVPLDFFHALPVHKVRTAKRRRAKAG